ncbi:MAG: hypothetical protein ACSLE6_03950 [Mycobacterium sp.]
MADYDTGADTPAEEPTAETVSSEGFVTDVEQFTIVSDFTDFTDFTGFTEAIAEDVDSGAATMLDSLDVSGDGTMDTDYVDYDGDNSADYIVSDTDDDGVIDMVQVDETGDGVPDTALLDSDSDGISDTVLAGGDDERWGVQLIDEDQDGEFDTQLTYDTATESWVEDAQVGDNTGTIEDDANHIEVDDSGSVGI